MSPENRAKAVVGYFPAIPEKVRPQLAEIITRAIKRALNQWLAKLEINNDEARMTKAGVVKFANVRKPVFIVVMIGVVLFVVVGFIVPLSRPARAVKSAIACETNLRSIDIAKGLWAAEVNPTNGTLPAPPVIQRFLGEKVKLVCPYGGHYEYGRFGEGPRCSCGRRMTANGELIRP